MSDRFRFTGIIILVIIFFCSLSCFEKKTTDPDSGRPDAPSNPTPAIGAIDQPLDLTLSWSCSDPEGDPLTYDIYFGTTAIPLLRSENRYIPQYEVSFLNQGTTYYWRVVAEDDEGNQGHGEVWSFTTEGEDSGGDDAWGEAELLFGGMYAPSITADGHTIYMTRNDWFYVSNKTGDTWSDPVALPYPVNDSSSNLFTGGPSITGDGSTLYFSRLAYGFSYWSSRKISGVWQEPQRVPIDTTNLWFSNNMLISWDGTTLYFNASVRQSQNEDIYYSTFNGSSWSAPQPFTAVNTEEYDELGMAAINGGGNAFYFTTRDRPEVSGTYSIWVSYKSWGSWQNPVPLGETINMPDRNSRSDPAISYDGSRFYFDASSSYPNPSGIYVATAAR